MQGRRSRCSYGKLLVDKLAVEAQKHEVASEISREMMLLTSEDYWVYFEEQIEDCIYHGHEEGSSQDDWLSEHAERTDDGQ